MFVYLLQSEADPDQRYVGLAKDVHERLKAHNWGESPYTSKYRPWRLVMYLWFSEKKRAADFEKYLKSGSGQAFANKRFW
ncbi:MAG: GIY-YIG nuclease family protein [Gammaproteobacteria bacterium]